MDADPEKDIWYTWDAVIGTMIMSVAYMHLYHLCTGSYSDHKALQEYYQKMPYDIDRLAEVYLADKLSVNFINAIVPPKNLRDYVMELRGYLTRFKSKVDSNSPYLSLFDNVINTLMELFYKLYRLKDKSTSFSMISNRYEGKDVDNMVESISDAIKAYIRKYKKSPVKEIGVRDSDKRIKQYVRSKMFNGKDMSELIDSLMRVLTAPLTIKGAFK
jgi:predicted CopG family antitoxin